ncbi:MAG: 3-hydroxyacyl-CoA dehydrogenase/enoyl-CoA hydratase family protein [Gammaproteobacteria bacterium]
MRTNYSIRKVAVLGAGVMGAQIAAHLANADIRVLLFDLASPGEDPNAIVRKAMLGLKKMDPAPLAAPWRAELITEANYDADLPKLCDCELVIEAIAERADLKAALYAKVLPHLKEDALLASNTSGLSINGLGRALPEALRTRFCGVHFFNPPRYMHLVELIPAEETRAEILDFLEGFLVTRLGKGVVRAKDTPNFLGNRIGVFSLMAAIYHAERLGLPLDLVDALTGLLIGRPKSATFRTADIVGLDTLAHIVEGSQRALSGDPWRDHYRLPEWLKSLIAQGSLGQKSGAGLYRKEGQTILVFEPGSGAYRPSGGKPAAEVLGILKSGDMAQRFEALYRSEHREAQFLWAIHRDVFHYAAFWLQQIADNARDLDLAMRWGFGWEQGPFEIWQTAGWRAVAARLTKDIWLGKTMASAALPSWVDGLEGVHTPQGSWAPKHSCFRPCSDLPVYRRQLFPIQMLGSGKDPQGQTVFENEGVRLWHLGDAVAILSFTSKMHTIGEEVMDGVLASLEIAERDFAALVIWHPDPPFSAGANLAEFLPVLKSGDSEAIGRAVDKFQGTALQLRYSQIPVVAAPHGLALGGGVELLMHCDRVVAALETYIGLVEVGVGLIPAGGGGKELAMRAARNAPDGDPFPQLRRYFETVAKAEVAKSGEQAKEWGLLREGDVIVFNTHELLYVAKSEAKAMAEAGYRPALPRPVRVAGRTGVATLRAVLVNLREGGMISEHDYTVTRKLAEVMCGGNIEAGTEVDERWLLRLEREAFVALAQTELSQARIEHMLATGKPLRN